MENAWWGTQVSDTTKNVECQKVYGGFSLRMEGRLGTGQGRGECTTSNLTGRLGYIFIDLIGHPQRLASQLNQSRSNQVKSLVVNVFLKYSTVSTIEMFNILALDQSVPDRLVFFQMFMGDIDYLWGVSPSLEVCYAPNSEKYIKASTKILLSPNI